MEAKTCAEKAKKSCSVNMKLLPLKIHFFLFGAGVASFSPYLPLFAHQNGLSPTAIGALYFAVPVVAFVAKPFFGWLADKYRKEKLIAIGMLLVSAVFYFIMSTIPPIAKERNFIMEFECANYGVKINPLNSTCFLGPERNLLCKIVCTRCKNDSATPYNCEHQFEYTKVNITIGNSHNHINSGDIACPTNSTSRCEIDCPCDKWCCSTNSEYYTTTFWTFFVCFIFVGIGERVLRGLTDAICFEMLKDRAKDYGRQKLWQNFGSCGAPFLAGYLLDVTKEGTMYNYSVAIYLSIAFMAADIITSYKLDLADIDQRKKSAGICRDTLLFFFKLKHLVLAVAACVGGAMFGFDVVYYNMFMQEIGASKLLIGISLAAGVFTRVPLLFYSGNIIAVLGHFNTISLSLVCIAIRFITLAQLYNPLWVLLPQIILCSAIDLSTITISAYAKYWAPPGTEATLQQAMGAIFGGIGIGFGYGFGGLAFDYYGSRKTYIITSIISGSCGILTFIFSMYTYYQKKQIRKEINKAVGSELNAKTKSIETECMLKSSKV